MRQAPDETLNARKDAIIATTRALAQRKHLSIAFEGSAKQNATLTLPALQDISDEPAVSYTRGVADFAALLLRHHNADLHQKLRPSTPQAAKLFDVLETIRVETLGSQHLLGTQHNLYRRFEHECLQNTFETREVPLVEQMEILARNMIQHQRTPETKLQTLKTAQTDFTLLLPQLTQLSLFIENQTEYAKLATRLIETLASQAKTQTEHKPSDEQEESEKPEQQSSDKKSEKKEPREMGDGAAEQDTQQILTLMKSGSIAEEDGQMQKVHEPPSRSTPYPFNSPDSMDKGVPYNAYTREFDEIVSASSLATPDELASLRKQLDAKLQLYPSITARLASRLQRLLLARQARRWIYDEEDGLLDSKKLPRVIIDPAYSYFYKHESETEYRDTVVTLLIDNSGSMRGRPITMAAISADILSRTLERCGVKVEILGFTTKEWKGGDSYKLWLKRGKPARPGRLNDLRHIIYKPADASWRKAQKNLGLMLKEGILKENIDGEAILWACDRLLARPEQRRILMVISDGAPVDDSTLSVNAGSYLDLHLREVIATVEGKMPIELLAIGIGHDVTRYYKRAVTINDIDKLGETMTEQLSQLFA